MTNTTQDTTQLHAEAGQSPKKATKGLGTPIAAFNIKVHHTPNGKLRRAFYNLNIFEDDCSTFFPLN